VFVLALQVDGHLPASGSLKDKRQVLRSVLDGARARFSVAAAEVDQKDKWQRTSLGFAAVSASARHAEEVIDAVERFVWAQPGLEVLEVQRTWLE